MPAKKTLNLQARFDVRALALCTRFYASKGVFLEKRGTLLRWIVDDLCQLIQKSKGWDYVSTEESIQQLKAYGIDPTDLAASKSKSYLEDLEALETSSTVEDISDTEVQEALRLLEQQKKQSQE